MKNDEIFILKYLEIINEESSGVAFPKNLNLSFIRDEDSEVGELMNEDGEFIKNLKICEKTINKCFKPNRGRC